MLNPSYYLFITDSDYENANRSADVDVELMAFQSIIGDDYKGQTSISHTQTPNYNIQEKNSLLCRLFLHEHIIFLYLLKSFALIKLELRKYLL